MLPLKTTFTSQYLKKLQERSAAWSTASNQLGFRLVPEASGFDWINNLEHGTRQGKGPYIITPTPGRFKLVFISEGVLHFEGQVLHPGIHPHRFIANSLPDIRELYKRGIIKYGVDNPSHLQDYLESLGKEIKIIITENLTLVTKSEIQKAEERRFGAQFPNQAGRLGGRSAAQEFERIVKVVKI